MRVDRWSKGPDRIDFFARAGVWESIVSDPFDYYCGHPSGSVASGAKQVPNRYRFLAWREFVRLDRQTVGGVNVEGNVPIDDRILTIRVPGTVYLTSDTPAAPTPPRPRQWRPVGVRYTVLETSDRDRVLVVGILRLGQEPERIAGLAFADRGLVVGFARDAEQVFLIAHRRSPAADFPFVRGNGTHQGLRRIARDSRLTDLIPTSGAELGGPCCERLLKTGLRADHNLVYVEPESVRVPVAGNHVGGRASAKRHRRDQGFSSHRHPPFTTLSVS